jgi:hypothetical protein
MSDLSPETRAMLARGRAGHALPEGRRRGMKRALLVRIAGGTLVASTTSATALAGKVVAVAILVGAFSVGVANVVESRSAARPPAPVSVPAAAPIAQAGPPRGSSPARPPEAPPGAPEMATAEPVATAMAVPTGEVPVAPAAADSVATATVRRAARGTPIATAATARIATTLDAPVSSAPSSSAPPLSAPSLQAEATLLLEAHQALHAGDPETALRLLGDHAARFPGSALAPERSAERVLALCQAGRNVEARREGQAFLAVSGSGPLALRVQRSCAGGGE